MIPIAEHVGVIYLGWSQLKKYYVSIIFVPPSLKIVWKLLSTTILVGFTPKNVVTYFPSLSHQSGKTLGEVGGGLHEMQPNFS